MIGPIKNRVRGGGGAPWVIFALRQSTEDEIGTCDGWGKERKGSKKKKVKSKKKKEDFFSLYFTIGELAF